MTKAIIYHNPKCSKSRKALEILESKNIEIEVREYLKNGLDSQQIDMLVSALNMSPLDFMRKNEDEFKSMKIESNDFDGACKALISIPKLLERPIIIVGSKAVIGRPAENIEKLF